MKPPPLPPSYKSYMKLKKSVFVHIKRNWETIYNWCHHRPFTPSSVGCVCCLPPLQRSIWIVHFVMDLFLTHRNLHTVLCAHTSWEMGEFQKCCSCSDLIIIKKCALTHSLTNSKRKHAQQPVCVCMTHRSSRHLTSPLLSVRPACHMMEKL